MVERGVKFAAAVLGSAIGCFLFYPSFGLRLRMVDEQQNPSDLVVSSSKLQWP